MNIVSFTLQLHLWVGPMAVLDSGITALRNFVSDHFALRAKLLHRPTHCHGVYLIECCTFPLNLPLTGPLNLMDIKFQYLKTLEIPPPPYARAPISEWMSEESPQLIGECAALRQKLDYTRNVGHTLTRSI